MSNPDLLGSIPHKCPVKRIIAVIRDITEMTGCGILKTTIIPASDKTLSMATATNLIFMWISIPLKQQIL
jgi:hypothetical protein